MKRHLLSLLFAALAALPAMAASDRGTPEEARAMAEKAAVYFQENGLEASRVAFDDPSGPWQDRDLYVFVYELDGTNVILGSNPAIEGKNLIDLKDADGNLLIQAIVGVPEADWVHYMWLNPANQKIEAKSSWVIRVDEYALGVGAYDEQ